MHLTKCILNIRPVFDQFSTQNFSVFHHLLYLVSIFDQYITTSSSIFLEQYLNNTNSITPGPYLTNFWTYPWHFGTKSANNTILLSGPCRLGKGTLFCFPGKFNATHSLVFGDFNPAFLENKIYFFPRKSLKATHLAERQLPLRSRYFYIFYGVSSFPIKMRVFFPQEIVYYPHTYSLSGDKKKTSDE